MKIFFCVVISLTTFLSIAKADQVATLTCTGSNVVLFVKSPYLGENSKAAQELYVLTRKSEANKDESQYTAYFLDISPDADFHRVYVSGKNAEGGSFLLKTNFPVDDSDGTTIREVSQGTLTYSHGPLQGKDEPVDCVAE